eukprot:Gb_38438 [translate_table: standard]
MSVFRSLPLLFALICTLNTIHRVVEGETLSKIYCQANPNFYLAAKDGNLVMKLANDSDPHQQWIVNNEWGSIIKDEAGFPSIAFVNKATAELMLIQVGFVCYFGCINQAVTVIYHQDDLHTEYLWTQSEDVGHGYQSLRPLNNIHLSLEVQIGDDEKESISEASKVILSRQNGIENQRWKISPIVDVPKGDEVRIYCEANPDFFLTGRDTFALLAAGNTSDIHQHWIKVVSWGLTVKDEVGFPAFALVNKATLKALKHGDQEWDQIYLTDYTENTLDESILWTQSADVGKGYQCVRPVNNIHLNMDAKQADGKNGVVYDGNELILFRWKKQSNQKWKMMPFT